MTYQIKWKGLLSLKTSVIFIWILCWNLLLGVAVYYNEGLGPIRNSTSGLIASFTLTLTSFFCLFLIIHKDFRDKVLDNHRGNLFDNSPFLAIGTITLLLGIAVNFA